MSTLVSWSNWQQLPRISGIYRIVHLTTGREYIGSAQDIRFRAGKHRRDLLNGKHHSIVLTRTFRKYGWNSFAFGILETVDGGNLLEREQWFIDTRKPLFNMAPVAGSCRGVKHTKETCQKRSEASRRNWEKRWAEIPRKNKPVPRTISEGVRAALSKLTSEQLKQRMALALVGQKKWRKSNIIAVKAMTAGMTATKRAKYAKLNPESVAELRRLQRNGVSFTTLSNRFSISVSGVHAVVHRRIWADVP